MKLKTERIIKHAAVSFIVVFIVSNIIIL